MTSIEKLLVSNLTVDFGKFNLDCLDKYVYKESDECNRLLQNLSKAIFYQLSQYPDGVSITRAPFKLVTEELIDSLYLSFMFSTEKDIVTTRASYVQFIENNMPQASDSISDKIKKINVLRASPLGIVFFIGYLREYFYKNIIMVLKELIRIINGNDLVISGYWSDYYLKKYGLDGEWQEIKQAFASDNIHDIRYYKAINLGFMAIMLYDNNRRAFSNSKVAFDIGVFKEGVKMMNGFVYAHSYSMNLVNVTKSADLKEVVDKTGVIFSGLDGILYDNFYFVYNLFLKKYYYGDAGNLTDLFRTDQYFTLSKYATKQLQELGANVAVNVGEKNKMAKNKLDRGVRERWILKGFEPVHARELQIFSFDILKDNVRFYWRNVVAIGGGNSPVNRQLVRMDNKKQITFGEVTIVTSEMKMDKDVIPVLRVDINRRAMYIFFSLPYSLLSDANRGVQNGKHLVETVTHYMVRLCDKKIIGVASGNNASFPGMTYAPSVMPNFFVHVGKCLSSEFVLFVLCLIREQMAPIGKKQLTTQMMNRMRKLFRNKLKLGSNKQVGLRLDSNRMGYIGAQIVNKSECMNVMPDKMKEQYLRL